MEPQTLTHFRRTPALVLYTVMILVVNLKGEFGRCEKAQRVIENLRVEVSVLLKSDFSNLSISL